MTEMQASDQDNMLQNDEAIPDEADYFSFKEMVLVFAQVLPLSLLFYFFVKTFIFQSFFIPSESMVPSLQVGDHLFVSKYQYGYSHHSMPFSTKLFSGRIMASSPVRGDVVVFKQADTNYIKRVVGLPGDSIQVKKSILFINGEAVKVKKIKDFVIRDFYGHKRGYPTFQETLPNQVSHTILELLDHTHGDNTALVVVPEGHYFMMGDNRDNSNDSRFNAPIGFVPFENLVGKAQFIYFSKEHDKEVKQWFWQKIRWSRMFTWIT